MKKSKTGLVFLLALTMFLSACKKDKDDNTATAALLFLLDQTSGNCAVVTRTSSTLFTANLTVIPKGGCNQATITGSSLAANTLLTQANYDAAQTLATSLGCTANTKTALTTAKNAVNTSATAQSTFDTNAEKTRYFPIADLRVEGIVALNTALSPLGFSQAEVLALNLLSVDLLKALTPITYLSTAATGAGDAACLTAVGNKIATDYAGVYTYDQTATTKAKITKLAQAQCTYGSGAAVTSTCATLNTQF
ncbi:hypothetical protein DLM78_04470 [Leptospira stimsonii]|uniref:Lipoprotein n=1 Tax=Leptospira stimsonii TaxID=2202203 RepID=A0A8B3CU50_9LEPT|nr:hypothetical protein DLM78_04470 [Leptospira stimsonii]